MAKVTKAEIAQYERMTEMIEQLTEKRNAIRDKIIAGVPAGKPASVEHKGSQYIVKHTLSSRLDAKAVEANYPATSHPEFYTQKLDTKLVPEDVRMLHLNEVHNVKVEKVETL